MTLDEIRAIAEARKAATEKKRRAEAKEQPPGMTMENPAARMAREDGVARGLGLGVRNVVEGAAGALGVVADPLAAGLFHSNAGAPNIKPLRQSASDAMTAMGLPVPMTQRERVLSAGVEGGAGAAVGAGMSRIAANALTGVGGNVANMMAAGPGAQTVGGVGAGLGQQMAAEAGAGAVGQAAAGLGAGILAGGIAGARRTPSVADDVVAAGRKYGVRVMGTDVAPPNTFAGRWLRGMGEKIPVAGTGGPRAAQAAERVAAVRTFVGDYSPDIAALPDDVLASVTDDLLRGRNAALSKYTQQKGEVFSSLAGKGVVPVTKTVAAIDDEIAKLRGLGLRQNAPLIAMLDDWKTAIQGKDIEQIEVLRQQLGEAYKAPSLADISKEADKVIRRLYGPLREEMGEFIKQNGAPRDYTKWKVANMRLSQMADDLNMPVLKAVLDKGDVTPEDVKRLLFSQKVSDVRKLYRELSPAGRGHARAAILHEVLLKSGGLDNISPKRFEANLRRLPRQISTFFTGADKKVAEGFTRLLAATRRADEAALNPPTGAQVVPIVGGMAATDLLGGFGAGVASLGTVGGLARLYESRAMRPILIALSNVKLGAAEQAALINRALAVYRLMSGGSDATGER